MITDTLKEIADTASKLEALRKKAAAEVEKKLKGLHKDLGFESRADLIAALRDLDSSSSSAKPATKRGRKPKAAASTGGKKKRAKRTRITPEMKSEIIAAVKAGGKGTQIAADFGISVPSLQNIKKEAGLVKARG